MSAQCTQREPNAELGEGGLVLSSHDQYSSHALVDLLLLLRALEHWSTFVHPTHTLFSVRSFAFYPVYWRWVCCNNSLAFGLLLYVWCVGSGYTVYADKVECSGGCTKRESLLCPHTHFTGENIFFYFFARAREVMLILWRYEKKLLAIAALMRGNCFFFFFFVFSFYGMLRKSDFWIEFNFF